MKKKIHLIISIKNTRLILLGILFTFALSSCNKTNIAKNEQIQEFDLNSYEGLTESIDAFNKFSEKIETSYREGTLPISIVKVWEDSIKIKQFKLRTVQTLENGNFRISNLELDDFLAYVESFELLFNAIEDSFETKKITPSLTNILSSFEISEGISLTTNEDRPELESRGKKRYCCCCTSQGRLDDCKSFKARKWWAKIKCKIIGRIFRCGKYETDLSRGRCN